MILKTALAFRFMWAKWALIEHWESIVERVNVLIKVFLEFGPIHAKRTLELGLLSTFKSNMARE